MGSLVGSLVSEVPDGAPDGVETHGVQRWACGCCDVHTTREAEAALGPRVGDSYGLAGCEERVGRSVGSRMGSLVSEVPAGALDGVETHGVPRWARDCWVVRTTGKAYAVLGPRRDDSYGLAGCEERLGRSVGSVVHSSVSEVPDGAPGGVETHGVPRLAWDLRVVHTTRSAEGALVPRMGDCCGLAGCEERVGHSVGSLVRSLVSEVPDGAPGGVETHGVPRWACASRVVHKRREAEAALAP